MNFELKEKLCVEVQKYPFLYDKSNKDYKNRVVVDEAWKVITQSLGLEGLYVILLSLVAYPQILPRPPNFQGNYGT